MKMFGIKSHGKHSVITLNVKIRKEDMEYLQESYQDLNIYPIGKGLTRIEGCIRWQHTDIFIDEMKQACNNYKIELLQQQNLNIKNKYALDVVSNVDDLNIL